MTPTPAHEASPRGGTQGLLLKIARENAAAGLPLPANAAQLLAEEGSAGWRSEQGVADPRWPVAGRAGLGELTFDVHVDGAEEVDVLAVRRRDVGQHLVVDTRPALRIDSTAKP